MRWSGRYGALVLVSVLLMGAGEPRAEEPSAADAVLTTARRMIDEGVVVRGSCWDWANAVFKRAGFPNRRGRRETVAQASQRGPYLDVSQIRPGDWLYHINHSWNDCTHSAIFVRWVDRERKIGLTASYAGSRRDVPGRFEEYDLSSVYRIIRACE